MKSYKSINFDDFTQLLEIPNLIGWLIAFEGMMKFQILPFHDVRIHKIISTHRVMISFVSEDRYDPNKAQGHTCWALISARKNYRSTEI